MPKVGYGHCKFLDMNFCTSATSLNCKQECIEKLFSATRRKLHPLIRMDDFLDCRKSSSIKHIVQNMAARVWDPIPESFGIEKGGSWFNVSVALDRDRHLSTEENWQKLLVDLHSLVHMHVQNPRIEGEEMQWKIDLIPASDKFVVDHVINEGSQFRKPKNSVVDTEEGLEAASFLGLSGSSRRQRPPMHHEPLYHLYIQCTKSFPVVEDEHTDQRKLEHMDIMYSRWSVQNPVQLRQRILEKIGTEVLVSEAVIMNKESSHNRKKHVPLSFSNRKSDAPRNPGYARQRW